jgi:ATP/maltotriose-dependent transcriptional regulator MalT
VALGRTAEALATLDEIMVYVVADRAAPPVRAGLLRRDLVVHGAFRRPTRWRMDASAHRLVRRAIRTDALPGEVQVHQAEIFKFTVVGGLPKEQSGRQRVPAAGFVAGGAHYRLARLHRLRGQLDLAEREYAAAASCGREVQPGLALLRAAQGNPTAAIAGVDRALAESRDPALRSLLLAAKVEIALAAGITDSAPAALAELDQNAEAIQTPYLAALAAHAAGQFRLAQGDPQAALTSLRRAWTLWQQVDAPYEAARTRVLVSAACRALGDDDAARMELDAARIAFEQLGARSDLASLAPADEATPGHPLTAREREVLALVAQGQTNRGIATMLFLSEKTVARHLSNIFSKINVNSRAAATAYAYEHRLV